MFELTSADAGDIAITAAEGGIGYWSIIDEYNWKRWDGVNTLPDDFVFYTLREIDNPDGVDITVALIRRGWLRLLERWEKRSLNPFGFDPRDSGTWDTNVCDIIVQLGLFDEVVYG